MSPDPVALSVYDKDFTWQGYVPEFTALRATRRHAELSTMEFTAPPDVDVRAALAASGAHVVCTYLGAPFVGGWVSSDGGTLLPTDDVTYTVQGHGALLRHLQGWPVPAAGTGGQTVPYWTMTGPAETVAKAVLAANVTRLGLPVTVAPDLGRGATVSLASRFHPVADRLLPAIASTGIGVTVDLVEGVGLVIDCYVPTVHTLPLTAASGVIVAGTWRRVWPTVTRVVAGSQGEAEARVFFGPLVDAAREAEWGVVIEAFIDARDTDDPAVVTARMQEALDAGAPGVELSVSLVETPDFAYADPYYVGDVVPITLGPGVTTTDVIFEAELVSTVDGGHEMTPRIGKSSSGQVARAVDVLAVDVRDSKRR